jgi:peroxiredoxin
LVIGIGSQAPDFVLQNQRGEFVSLASFRGAKNVVLVFFPFAFSSVCTRELTEIRDRSGSLADERTELVAISCDPMFALRSYADRDGFRFPLLSDFWPHGAVASAYGVFDERRGCAGRATVVVDREGVVRWTVQNEIPDARNLDDLRKALDEL